VDLRDLRLVVVLADELHFGRSAERLHVGQPALSQQLRRLERRLGVQLFERSTHHVRLTPAGQTFVHHARPALAAVERLVTALRAHSATSTLRIGSLAPTYDVSQLVVHSLVEALPDLEVTEQLVPGFAAGRRALLDGHCELYLGPVGQGGGLESLPLRSDRFGLWLTPDHPLADRSEVPIAELSDVPLQVDPGELSPEIVAMVEHMFARSGARLHRLSGASGSQYAAVMALASGGGEPLVGPLLRPIPQGVVWRPFADPHAHGAMHLVWRSGDERPLVARAVAVVREAVARQGWQLLDDHGRAIT
jgi:DNA-binding transcriptional LysR family regulator